MGKTTTGRLNNGVPQVPPPKQASDLTSFQQTLPIYMMRESITKAINDNRVLLVAGETGSGKTTQVLRIPVDYITRYITFLTWSKEPFKYWVSYVTIRDVMCSVAYVCRTPDVTSLQLINHHFFSPPLSKIIRWFLMKEILDDIHMVSHIVSPAQSIVS